MVFCFCETFLTIFWGFKISENPTANEKKRVNMYLPVIPPALNKPRLTFKQFFSPRPFPSLVSFRRSYACCSHSFTLSFNFTVLSETEKNVALSAHTCTLDVYLCKHLCTDKDKSHNSIDFLDT